ncbi:MAG: ATP-binding cassette domain-containing protein [Bacteroidales bacterium]|nr:ATP-binding cassette domain-containing protein [Bacteroidales bacterium]
MHDIVLSSLINLFALIGKRNGVGKERSLDLIRTYLRVFYGVQNYESYAELYSELRDFYENSAELDASGIIGGICANLISRVNVEEQQALLLRVMEFCKLGGGEFHSDDLVFTNIRDQFGISSGKYASYCHFVEDEPDDNIWIQPLWGGTLKALYDREKHTLIFTFEGETTVLMNDNPVANGLFQTWQQSGVLKGTGPQARNSHPMYYSTLMALFDASERPDSVELCGRNIEYRFPDGSGNGMHNFSFVLESGQLVAIMGGSGVGKSTLLSLLNGTLRPQSGSITVNGHDITEPDAKAHIGFVPQDDLLIEELTVYQNLWYTAKLCFDRMPDEEIDKRVMSILSQLGLDAAKDLKVGSPINKFISGGQRKRLNIALELIREPSILFLDEPTSGLSSSDTEKVINLLKEQTGKGKLIVVNIHQPSSNVYKLFDRLWLLDKGGYPVFDGNPIDAITYFKSAANYADSQVSACPTCGNVNPDVILNIIDDTSLDSRGNRTDKRKVTPKQWHQLYLDSRPEMEPADVSSVPPTDQKRPGKFKQMLIFLRRNIAAKLTDAQYLAVTLIEAPALALISAVLTHFTPDNGVYCVMDNKNLPSYLFMAIIVSIFLGMSGSAEEIIKDRALLKREKFLNLSYGSYIWSKMLYMAVVCLVQTFLFIVVGNAIMGITGMFWTWWALLFVSAFLSSLIGLLLSQCLSSVVSIYITIPLLLIPQILLCGLVVHFEDLTPNSETGNVPLVGDVIPSRWSYEALAMATFSKNEYKSMTYELDCEKFTCQFYEQRYIYELESQLEKKQDELRKGKTPNPRRDRILLNGLERLSDACAIEPYGGDWSYDSLNDYLESAKKTLSKRGNAITLKIDRMMAPIVREKGSAALADLKRKNYNLQLENLAVNLNAEHTYAIVGDKIVPRIGYAYLKPVSRNGRAPFYSGVKVLGNREIDTYRYNLGVLVLMCVLLSICLLTDFPGKIVRKD